MYHDISNVEYDYVIFGTSLVESTLSSYLSKLNKKILHIDISKSYGGDCKNLNLQELEKFINESKDNQCTDLYLKQFKLIDCFLSSDDIITTENYRNYNFDLNPKFIYSKSKSTEELTSSNASKYLEFMSVSHIYFFDKKKLLKVPFSKSEIFTSNDLELIEKQKLLAFLYGIMKIKNTVIDVNTTTDIKKDYELDNAILSQLKANLSQSCTKFLNEHFSPKIQSMITLILGEIDPNANCDLITVDDLITKIYKFLLAVQIYDNTPYLYPLYGSSEFSQAFCRQSSVYGTIFLINDRIKIQIVLNPHNEINKESKKYLLNITDESRNETFNVYSDSVIINEAYISDNKQVQSPLTFGPGIVIKNMNDTRKIMKYICFATIKHITELRKDNDGPIYYKVKKNDEDLSNCYGFTAIEYFNNTHSAPKHRSVLEVIIINDKEEEESVFIEKCKIISLDFIASRMEDIGIEIQKEYKNRKSKKELDSLLKHMDIIHIKKESIDLPPEIDASLEVNKESEAKTESDNIIKESDIKLKEEGIEQKDKDKDIPKEPQKEQISILPHILFQYDFLHISYNDDYTLIHSEDKPVDIIITKNNNKEIDLDSYFVECESIINKNILVPLGEEPKVNEEERKSDVSAETDLIDELFNSINIQIDEKQP